jgi:hypothetical protein
MALAFLDNLLLVLLLILVLVLVPIPALLVANLVPLKVRRTVQAYVAKVRAIG